ncbi:hypothetical protein MUCCIDRAFT_164403 [Mucor lusitanicus CBS 277.49]|uniref:SRA1/Sec31 domain-containing protein n=1 Tax=Mucor lusitanicus CBS 277.49 TaxID=747725 RepID=A0A168KJS9_MUCCL|nr:hypothetical protein MUCCIDRAFT_164403 [Mucor lusitanicus CBS 277.49]
MTQLPPPPPPATASRKTLPATPPPSSDFRTAVIKNHWNDPPKKIFHKNTDDEDVTLDVQEVSKTLSSKLELCKSTFEKRIVDDTSRRIGTLLGELEKKELSNDVVKSLHTLTNALEAKEYTKALEVHTQLMTTQYESHGNWIVGLKRLVDLTEKASA